ncbi:MAG: YafY family transcriptional regulator, partial [Ktedonobacteraceae bacterium]|nr:YafY family transcriptional regulator [Ktedonobacteraceae bacterium]
MRADRLLSIMLLLQVHRRLTTRELARRLEVSERTIHRDMEALSSTGIPVLAERGSNGGWSLLEEYRTNLTGLNEAEIQALFFMRPAQLLSDLGLHQASEAGLIKLLAALPSISRHDAEAARQRIYVDTSGWHKIQEDISGLPRLHKAIWQESRLRFNYRSGDQTYERIVDPLGLVAKGAVWYLVAAVEGQARTYRVARMQDVTILDEPCTRPKDFNLALFWTQSTSDFVSSLPRYHATVRISPQILPRLQGMSRLARIKHQEVDDTSGLITLRLQFEDVLEAGGCLLSFGTAIEI